MKVSPIALKNENKTPTTARPVEERENDRILDDEIYIVTVDSRGKSPSDLESYKESCCNSEFFRDHIHDDPKNICVKSQVAGLCGLDIKVFFHDHSHLHHLEELQKPLSPIGRTNGVATLLLFNPETGKFNYVVNGKAYVLLNDGRDALSKRQVWGIVEMIREAKTLYEEMEERYHASDGGSKIAVDHSSSPALQHAYKELLKWCSHYKQGTWAPHSIYEPRHPHHHHHHDKREDPPAVVKEGCGCNYYNRQESGISDAATCHHGVCHKHHDVCSHHLKCS
mmetsp:Transcript_27925/g.49551  ORF Transcript_27925/g.49551 Transcript_27925/m.49551 type:complete len:281 (-) Transcript_27925:184-1026(-)